MTNTHNKAIAILATGNQARAWEVAQQDEGLLPHITFGAWLAFAEACVARHVAEAGVNHYEGWA